MEGRSLPKIEKPRSNVELRKKQKIRIEGHLVVLKVVLLLMSPAFAKSTEVDEPIASEDEMILTLAQRVETTSLVFELALVQLLLIPALSTTCREGLDLVRVVERPVLGLEQKGSQSRKLRVEIFEVVLGHDEI
jgi:hypothetical protein